MSALALIEKIQNQAGGSIDWRSIRDEIHEEHKKAVISEERSQLIALHKLIMDGVEINIVDQSQLAEFKKVRDQDYCLMLAIEIVMPDGQVNPELMDTVTRREIQAGRMSEDHQVRKMVVDFLASQHRAVPEQKQQKGILEKIGRLWRKG